MGAKYYIYCIIAVVLLYSCSTNINLERSLKLSGENRLELKKVLRHYSQDPSDSLRLKAAEYLIEHMDAHYSYTSPELDNYYHLLDSIFSLNEIYGEATAMQDSLLNQLHFPIGHYKYLLDLHSISSEFLIDNIDRAFEAWESPYVKDLVFEDFCEYLLPYKMDNEYPDFWRSAYYDSIAPYAKAFLDTTIQTDRGLIWNKESLVLNGEEYVELPTDLFQKYSEFTVSCQVHPAELRLYARVFDFGFDENYSIGFTPYGWDWRSMLQINLDKANIVGADTLSTSCFTHIALSWSDNFFHFYVDGALKSRVNATLDMKRLIHNYIGQSQYKENVPFIGEIKDFRLYNRELNYFEIQSLAGIDKEIGTKESLQELVWKIRDLYYIYIIYESLMPGGYRPSQLMKMKKGSCYNYSILGTYIYRSLGIPSGIDYTPQWANRSMGHSWNVLYTGKEHHMEDYSFSALWDTIGSSLKSRDEKISKVFRMTYAKQPDTPVLNKRKKESIPAAFMTPCIKDVTNLYLDCADIRVSLLSRPANNQYHPYLCNFDNQNWVPIHWGKVKGKQAYFEKMGKGVAYLPAYFDETGVVPAGHPFVLTEEGTIQYLIPEMSKLQKLTLTRKYHLSNIAGKGELLLGGRFEVANKSDFSDSKIVYEVNEIPEICYNTVDLNLDAAYRYFRYMAPQESRGDISEIEIWSEGHKLTGKLIGNLNCPEESKAENAFDGNPLTTYVCHWGEQGCVGLDFGQAMEISSLRFLPRNDDNFIKEGEDYELFYWNNRWVSLGRQTGTSEQYLAYEDAPLNALFLLRNLTKGREERIFTYENGEQVWW